MKSDLSTAMLETLGFDVITDISPRPGLWIIEEGKIAIQMLPFNKQRKRIKKRVSKTNFKYFLNLARKNTPYRIDAFMKTTYGSIALDFKSEKVIYNLQREDYISNYKNIKSEYGMFLNLLDIHESESDKKITSELVMGHRYSSIKNQSYAENAIKLLVNDLFLYSINKPALQLSEGAILLQKSYSRFLRSYKQRASFTLDSKELANIEELIFMPTILQHGDVSDNNVIFSPKGDYKLIDLFDQLNALPVWFDVARILVTKAWILLSDKDFFCWFKKRFYNFYNVELVSPLCLAVAFRIAFILLSVKNSDLEDEINYEKCDQSFVYFYENYF